MKNRKINRSFLLPSKLLDDLENLADREDLSVNQLVCKILYLYLGDMELSKNKTLETYLNDPDIKHTISESKHKGEEIICYECKARRKDVDSKGYLIHKKNCSFITFD